jgi:hypothetical protein
MSAAAPLPSIGLLYDSPLPAENYAGDPAFLPHIGLVLAVAGGGVQGSLIASEAGADTLASTGVVPIAGSFGGVEVGADIFFAANIQPVEAIVTGVQAIGSVGMPPIWVTVNTAYPANWNPIIN